VSYFYDADLGDFYYGPTHPMKPHRVRMAHDLIVRYDLYKNLQVRQLRFRG
jgi:histone deacetylase 1/2